MTTMQILRYELVLEAVTPIAHHAETIGNQAIAMRRKVRQPHGGFVGVPYITGDTVRHKIREAASYAFLDAAGMLGDVKLTEAALRLLFAGGMVTGNGDGSTIKLDHYREMTDLVPPLALLGGCAENRVIPGKMNVEDALLICSETAHLIPAWMLAWARENGGLESARENIEEVTRVRMDPTLVPEKRLLLSDGSKAAVESRLSASEAAAAEGDAVGADRAKSSMMPRSHETIVAGARFAWRIEARTHSELERDTFHLMLAAFLENARVGGKQGTGHGQIRAVTGRDITVHPASSPGTDITLAAWSQNGDLFRRHVSERRERIAEFLRKVDA